MSTHLAEYEKKGWTCIPNFLTDDELEVARHETLRIKRWFDLYKMDGKPKDYGTGVYSWVIDCASILS
jgi:hypothetical protein